MAARKTSSADSKKVDDSQSPSVDTFSLSSIGTYMLFSEVNPESAHNYCEFIIKSNYIFPREQVLTVMINCPGGGVYDGFGMIDVMDCSRLKIQTVAIGIVASMGAVIFTAGTKGMRTMSRNSFIMTHQFSDLNEGKYHDLVASRAHGDDVHQRLVRHFTRCSKLSEKQVNDIILGPSDKYISAREALKYGLCDVIRDPWS